MWTRHLLSALFLLGLSACTNQPSEAPAQITEASWYRPGEIHGMNLPDGTPVEEGVWDFGSCAGEDRFMCGGYSDETPKIGCERQEPRCESGTAVAVAAANGDHLCTIRHWRWECRPEGYDIKRDLSNRADIQTWKDEIDQRHLQLRYDVARARVETYPTAKCNLQNPNTDLSDEAILISIRIYSSEAPSALPNWTFDGEPGRVLVDIAPEIYNQKRKIILLLSAYEPTEWVIGEGLYWTSAIIATGYYPQRVTTPGDWQLYYPIVLSSIHEDEPAAYDCPKFTNPNTNILWESKPTYSRQMTAQFTGREPDYYFGPPGHNHYVDGYIRIEADDLIPPPEKPINRD